MGFPVKCHVTVSSPYLRKNMKTISISKSRIVSAVAWAVALAETTVSHAQIAPPPSPQGQPAAQATAPPAPLPTPAITGPLQAAPPHQIMDGISVNGVVSGMGLWQSNPFAGDDPTQ